MNEILLEVLVIGVLLAANGAFALAEMAVVSARKSRLRQLADQGQAGARAALELATNPGRFLSTIQVGITLIGILAGTFGGATLARELDLFLQGLPALAPYSRPLSLGLVVAAITYGSLIVGELVPKRIALANPEGIALRVARPLGVLTRWGHPVVRLLDGSTNLLLRLLRVRPAGGLPITDEEVKGLMREGEQSGSFNPVESQIVQSALDLDQLKAHDLMTPRPRIVWINQDDPHETIWHKIVVSGYSSYPVYEGSRDHVVGLLSVKSIYANLAAGIPPRTRDLMTPPLQVPALLPALQLLETFKQTGRHMALVNDKFGTTVGLVTLHDVMEAVIGEFPSQEERARPQMRPREDGTWLMDGLVALADLERTLPGFRRPERESYATLAGYVVQQIGHIPREGETFPAQGYLFEVIDMDRQRVDKVLVTPARPGQTG